MEPPLEELPPDVPTPAVPVAAPPVAPLVELPALPPPTEPDLPPVLVPRPLDPPPLGWFAEKVTLSVSSIELRPPQAASRITHSAPEPLSRRSNEPPITAI